MCCSMAPAKFTGTKICLADIRVTTFGHVHVLMYQNSVASFSGPNAMLLHIPGKDIRQENFIDTTRFSRILDDMVEAVRPRGRGGYLGLANFRGMEIPPVQVFDVGIYTVVLATKASLIPAALDRVPAEKRPAMNPALFAFYEKAFPDFAVALCCFNNRAQKQAEPIMIWYRPKAADGLYRLPAIDCHTGDVPDLDADVQVDHWLFLASDQMSGGHEVNYRDSVPESVRQLLPRRVYGAYFGGQLRNGDFGIQRPEDLNISTGGEIRRLPPPAYA